MKINKNIYLMPFVAVLLIGGLWTALERLGWSLPAWPGGALNHGPLMIVGFLGALIALERAVALEKMWTYIAPIAMAAGGILSLVFSLNTPGYSLIVLGSAVNFATMIYLTKQQNILFNQIMMLGAGIFFLGNILWVSGYAVPYVIFFWSGYLLLTIFGERLELTRMVPVSKLNMKIVTFLLVIYTVLIILSIQWLAVSARLIGFVLILIAIWFSFNDIARRTIKMDGQPKYTSLGLLLGYFWSIISGMILLVWGFVPAGYIYDAFAHALFLGFVFSMIFVHAPIIFPAVFGTPMKFSNLFYSHLLLLQITLAGRIIGDFMANEELRLWFGLLNVIAIVLFIGNTILSVVRGMKERNQ